MATANGSLWGQRVSQFSTPLSCTSTTGCTGIGTQGLSLSINGMSNRIIYLIRRKQPYYFHFQRQTENRNLPCGIDRCSLDSQVSFYVSTDPVGGGSQNYINMIGNIGTIAPPVFPGTTVLSPGCTMWVTVDNTWPDVLFYQCGGAPFQGGLIIVLGNC